MKGHHAEAQAEAQAQATTAAVLNESPEEFRERMRSVAVARSPRAREVDGMERRWARDMEAFKTEHLAGHMPARIDGCAERIAKATSYEDYTE